MFYQPPPTDNENIDNTLQCIEGFRRLEHLKIYCKLDPPPSSDPTSTTPASLRTQMRTLRNLRSVLSSVRSGSALQSITINAGFTKTLRHVVDHTTLLDDLLASDMVAILSGFSGLRLLHLIVYDGDEEYGSQQWTAEMVRRLPDGWPAQVAVSVEVTFPAVRDGTSYYAISVAMVAHTLANPTAPSGSE